jgi:UDP-N-acetylmuramoyl-L-alanyl-D-glutamate--2,6-diaminopimelate ligase
MALIADYFYNQIWKIQSLASPHQRKIHYTYFMNLSLTSISGQKKPASAIISELTLHGVVNEESHLTTPEAMELHRHFSNAVKSGIEYLSMEVSSQALKNDITFGVTSMWAVS